MLARSPQRRSPGPLARAFDRFLLNRAAVAGVGIALPMLLLILSYPLWWAFRPNDIDLLAMNSGPTAKHWFGTDGVGRDVFARVLEGGRISLLVAVASTTLSAIIGFLFGAISALAGRWADAVSMRFVDLVMTLPPVIFLLVLASIAGTGIWPTVLVISLLSWPLLARMIRSRLLELRERDFVLAARGMGAGIGHLLFRHGLPNSIDILVVYATLQIANAILLEAGLSFLGLGIAPPAASWGNMLNAARSTAVLEQYPWQWLFPGAALILAVLAINFIGDGLRDAFDPRAELN
ncbi:MULTISPECIES: ABC transporter permease [Rhizobium]|jgi:peptide/nickel transport system permease protein|uniref:ABC transporter permease n=1 Tax=Rhizobium TaxID=379 RepID=UPI0007B51D62|nr:MULTISPECIES: ABC transporter permease [Rhizobium]KZS54963.1 peptide ABC transporter permease [Rhizobium anhuiense bv. trifolii]MBB3301741.1 peptide/nickel transport system permease protein [Rhizobium sp. BK112]MBB3370789.1 peptide/nickel transport system permease protein [Rhizobium sp. BK077]MBB3746750.1 peptide/nickel transport system permease protein [Rhizobium sp. BK591]MBB4115523.1 peptide/nickel transport system permease protein [Rhizobium sp. BK226]